jgi:hypothetical protein
METPSVGLKRTYSPPGALSHVADSTKEAAIAAELSGHAGHPVAVRLVSVSGSTGTTSINLEVDVPHHEFGMPWLPDAGLKEISDVAFANIVARVLQTVSDGTNYRACVTGRSYGSAMGPSGYRPRPTRISIVVEEAP